MSLCLPPELPLFDADGALSREFLLHRGYCCENCCRNCPYGYRRTLSPAAPPPAPAVEVPERIVSLCPSNTEILHALGLLDRVVGVDDWSDWPPEATQKPRVGPDLGVDLDLVEALRPDLVLASLSVPGMERNIEGLRRRGLPHLVLDAHSLGEIWDSIRTVGKATGTAERAEELVASLQERIQRVRRALARVRHRPRVYWEWWPKPLFAPGGRNWLTPLSELAGCVSVTRHVDAPAARPDPGEIVRANPELILLAWTGVAHAKVRPEVVRRRPGWEEIAAVRTGRIHVMEEGLFCRPSPRLIDGLELLAALAHPEAFPNA